MKKFYSLNSDIVSDKVSYFYYLYVNRSHKGI